MTSLWLSGSSVTFRPLLWRARRTVLLTTLLAVTHLSGCEKAVPPPPTARQPDAPNTRSPESVGPAEFVRVLTNGNYDETIEVLNRVKRMRHQGEIIPLLQAVWTGQGSQLPTSATEFASSSRVRIELADVLLQASKNGREDLTPGEYVAFARQLVTSSDPGSAAQALLVLGIANEPTDVPVLEGTLAKEAPATFRAAALAYVDSCAVPHSKVIAIASGLSKENGNYLLEAWETAQERRKWSCIRGAEKR